MKKLGITGGIGSGKSFISNILRTKNIPVYDCDAEAKRLTREDTNIRRQLTDLVGKELYANGFDKHVLADFLFANAENAARVNAIIHPAVKVDFLRWTEKHHAAPLVALESAILFESGFASLMDDVVLVCAPETVRIERVQKRDGISEAKIRGRMALQMSDEDKRDRANFFIVNDGVQPIAPQIEQLLDVCLHN